MIAVDTKVLLRYLLQPLDGSNPSWQTQKAIQTIHAASSVFLPDVVLAETEWVMEAVFNMSRAEIHDILYQLSCHNQFLFEDWNALHCALMDYKIYPKVDFSDRLIARRARNKGATTLYTFEKEGKLGALPIVTSLSTRH